MSLRKSDRDALYGICAVVVPFVAHTILVRVLSTMRGAETAPWSVTVLELSLSLFAGFAFVIRGWPSQAGLLFFWYVPVMLAGLWFYTTMFIGHFVRLSL